MGMYDRDWYREGDGSSGWFGRLPPVGKVMLILFVGALVTYVVFTRWGTGKNRGEMPEGMDEIVRGLAQRQGQRPQTIHEAAEQGDVGRAAELLAADPSLVSAVVRKDAPDQPLHQAVWNGHRAVADLLLRYGADVNARGDQGLTPLHYAARQGSAEVVELLLKHAADPELKDNQGLTPLLTAARTGEPDVPQRLLRHGARLDLHSAVCLGMVDKARGMLAADPQLVSRTPTRDALLTDAVASLRRRLAGTANGAEADVDRLVAELRSILEALIAQKADVNARGIARVAPLFEAVQLPHDDVARLLIQHGADVNARDGAGVTPLRLAERKSMQALLIEHGARR